MTYYVKKPIPVRAFQITKTSAERLPEWVLDYYRSGHLRLIEQGFCTKTLESESQFQRYGGWVIQGVRGEIYPCEESIFTETYEPAPPGAEELPHEPDTAA